MNFDQLDLEPIPKRVGSITTTRINTYKLGTVINKNGIFKIAYKNKEYDILYPNNFRPIIVFATNENDNWDLGKPSELGKPKLVSELSPYWSPIFEGMKVAIDTVENDAMLDGNYLNVKSKLELQKWINKHALKAKPDEDSQCTD